MNRTWVMYAAGFNGFGQISITSDPHFIRIPSKLTSSSTECMPNSVPQAKSVVFISWSSIGFINERNVLIIKGFIDGQEKQSLDLGSFPLHTNNSNTGVMMMTKHGILYFINKKGKLSQIIVKENIKDVEGKQCLPALEDNVFTHISISEVARRLYLLTDEGQLWFNEMDENSLLKPSCFPLPLTSPCNIDKITCGISHCLALSTNGLVFSWGTGSRGQLGHGKLNDEEAPRLIECLQGIKILSVSAGGWHSAALADTGDVYVWGCNKHGQLGFPALQDFHSCSSAFKKVARADPQKSTGKTEWAVPMLHTPTLLELEDRLSSEKFITVACISCGTRHSAAVTSSGQAVTWGWSKYGQLSHECCVATECDEINSIPKNKEKRKIDDCSDKPHLPSVVPYFNDEGLIVTSVECGHWNTVYQTQIKTDI